MSKHKFMNGRKNFSSSRQLMILLLMMISISFAYSQSGSIQGKVTSSEDGEPIIGVSVVLKGTTSGVITDLDGNYSIQYSDASQTLVFSMVGMKTVEIPIGNRSQLDVLLEPDFKMLEQVVVTGYTTQRRADLTGAVSVVDVGEMMKQGENNPIKALQGRVPGVTIIADGNPSGASSVIIRGNSTLTGRNEPLYIIDGVPTQSGMHELNANDIETIQVLRDASSASIYGSRAGKGVIIITTKKGKQGKPKVNFDSFVTSTRYGKVINMLNTKEFGTAQFQAMMNSGIDPNTNQIGYMYDYAYDINGFPVLNGIRVPKYIDARDGTNTMLSSELVSI